MANRFFIRWLSLILILVAAPLNAEEIQRSITVTGTGVVNTAPDQATITVGIETQDRTARGAMSQNNLRMNEMMAVLNNAGIAGQDVQTTALTLNPVWDHRQSGKQPQIIGYAAANLVTIRARDLDKLGMVLDQVSAAGANRIHSIQFGLQDTSAAMEQARRNATTDAKARAVLYAEGLGATLGPVLQISESGHSPRPQMMGMARAESMAMDVPVAGGEVGITAQITVTFALAE